MSEKYTIAAPGEEFTRARAKLDEMVGWLKGPEAEGFEHYELEAKLTKEGLELLRLLFQGHLDLRAVREAQQDSVVGSDGVARTQVRVSDRGLMTVFGPVRVPRLQYSKPGTTSVFPADSSLNLPEEVHSHGLRRHAAEQGAKGSFDESVAFMSSQTGGTVAKRQAEELARRAAEDFDIFYEARAADGPEETEDLLALSLDGKGIVMRKQDLREATRRAAERASPKLGTRLSPGEKKNRKRMTTVASVYTVERHERTAKEVMKGLAPVQDAAKPRPKARNKRVWASVKKSPAEVTAELFEEALRRDPEQKRTWVVLVDGDEDQLENVLLQAVCCGVVVCVVLDFIHVLEKLWKAAWCLFPKGDREAEKWVAQRALAVLEGRSSDVAAGLRRSATLRGLTGKKRKTMDKVANYLLRNRSFLRYDEALAAGWPIATGVIEGACRHLVKDRMDLTGARWSLVGAEAVLRLRALRSSGDFEEYWDFHLRQEHERNHQSRYADPFPLEKVA